MPEDKSAAVSVPAAAGKSVVEKDAPARPAVRKPAATKQPVGKATAAKQAPAKSAAPKLSKLDETKAKNKKALADALAKAQAVKFAQPPAVPPVTKTKAKAKAAKGGRKQKLVRHAFSMPEVEYAQIVALKKRIASLGGNVKRSELLRAGITLLSELNDVDLTAVMASVDRIKTGRPAKKG
jgi:hypothetical protein